MNRIETNSRAANKIDCITAMGDIQIVITEKKIFHHFILNISFFKHSELNFCRSKNIFVKYTLKKLTLFFFFLIVITL